MTGLAIVAIPSKDDYVWNLSSEKVPHMTLLFLGDSLPASAVPRVTSFLEHAAATSLRRFGMSVDRRGTLGDKSADVLFFENHWSDDVEGFLGFLLQDPDIQLAYNASKQFEGWTPHLTMGYPKTPAKPDTRDYPGTSWVSFDRIAIWTGDYEGPEFELAANSDMEVAMSDTMTADDMVGRFLKQYGVKGMKWGQRGAGKGPVKMGGKQQKKKPAHFSAPEHAQAKRLSKKPLHALSNKELKDLNERLNLEKNFKSLNPGKIEKGSKEAKDILNTVGIGIKIYDIAKHPATKAAVGVGAALVGGGAAKVAGPVMRAVTGGQAG